MNRNLLFPKILFAGILLANEAGAQCFPCGTGADGPYTASSTTTLAGGTYNYSSFTIDPGVTVSVTGTTALTIYCTGNVVINGVLDASGGNGTDGVTYVSGGVKGTGVAGGADGGDGVFSSPNGPLDGQTGSGMGPGTYGSAWSGGGGGAYSANGQSSGNSAGGFGGTAYGDAQLSIVYGGSGGGGGSGGYDCGAGGGGAGGGIIIISSCGTITIGANGAIRTNGGNGGSDGTGNCGGGGGGGGGSIWLASSTITNDGSISSLGGLGGASQVPGPPYYGTGGNGADGRIRLDYATFNGSGTVTPASGYTLTALTVTSSSTPDNGSGNGTATATPSGGNSPYTYAWTPGGQTSQTATGLTSGSYIVTVTDNSGCTVIDTVVVGTSVGITGADLFSGLTVFPNPSGNFIFLSSDFGVECEFVLELLDITGQPVMKQRIHTGVKWNHTLDVSSLSNGTYMLRLGNEEGYTVKKLTVLH